MQLVEFFRFRNQNWTIKSQFSYLNPLSLSEYWSIPSIYRKSLVQISFVGTLIKIECLH